MTLQPKNIFLKCVTLPLQGMKVKRFSPKEKGWVVAANDHLPGTGPIYELPASCEEQLGIFGGRLGVNWIRGEKGCKLTINSLTILYCVKE